MPHPEELAGLAIQATLASAAGGLAPPTIPSVYAAFSATSMGLVPASGGGTANLLRADGAWTNTLTGGLVLGATAGVALAITASGAAGQALTIIGNNSSPTMTISEAGGNGVRISFVSSAAGGKTYQIGHNFITGIGEFAIYDLARASAPLSISTTGTITVDSPIVTKGYTVATLPAGTLGMIAHVTDALAPAFLTAVVGGGAVKSLVFYNGATWVAA